MRNPITLLLGPATALFEIGRTLAGVPGLPGITGNTEPCCVALSPDGHTLAIGALDELGTVYLYKNPVTV